MFRRLKQIKQMCKKESGAIHFIPYPKQLDLDFQYNKDRNNELLHYGNTYSRTTNVYDCSQASNHFLYLFLLYGELSRFSVSEIKRKCAFFYQT